MENIKITDYEYPERSGMYSVSVEKLDDNKYQYNLLPIRGGKSYIGVSESNDKIPNTIP